MKILFLTTWYFPNNTGAAVVMHNLVKNINRNYVHGVVTSANNFYDKFEIIDNINVYKIFNFQYLFIPRIRTYVNDIAFRFEAQKVKRIIKNNNITHVVGVYPDLKFLELANFVSKTDDVKFIPYLHDTVVEGLSHTRFKKISKTIQKDVFKESSKILVMSEGMKKLYSQKYGINTIPIVHSFSEEIEVKKINKDKINESLFWGGSIYSINKECLKRIEESCLNLNLQLTLSAACTKKKLNRMGFKMKNISILPFLSRKDYIKNIEVQKALVLAIDWPDESPVHEDELRTIFPTKTIEYLISGRPIIVHCPANYFLSEFFKKNGCGIVINDRCIDKMCDQIDLAFSKNDNIEEMILNAYNTAKMFKIDNVKADFEKTIYKL